VSAATLDDDLLDRVREAAGSVPDPELPVVTLGQLGMVHDVKVQDGRVVVELLPTFSGCPATDAMGQDVRAAVAERVAEVDELGVRWLFQPVWSTDRITPEGHERLKEFGIAPPTGGGTVSTLQRPAGALSLPVAGTSTSPDGPPAAGGPDAAPDAPVACPYCDATDVVEDSPFGPTPCRAVWFCNACSQPFERFKPL
jgi:ring-1,2-phenylacetyl-CoA epoxidase subunit PaaD